MHRLQRLGDLFGNPSRQAFAFYGRAITSVSEHRSVVVIAAWCRVEPG